MVLIIACSFYFSKYGGRYFSIGQMAFMTIYFSFITQLSLEQLPWVYVGIVIGIIYAYIFNFIFFQDTIQTLKHSMKAFHIQANLTFNVLIAGISEKDMNPKRRKKIDKNVQKLHVFANIVIGKLNKDDIDHLWPGLTTSQLRSYVFDTRLLIETLTESFHKLKEADALKNKELRNILVWVMKALRDASIHSKEHNLQEAELAVQALRNVIGDFMEEKEETKEWIFLIRRIESIATHIVEVGITINQILLTG